MIITNHLETNKVLQYDVVDQVFSEGVLYYLVNTPIGRLRVRATFFQKKNINSPATILCQYIHNSTTGEWYLTQSLNSLYPKLYEDYSIHEFIVIEEGEVSAYGSKNYFVCDKYGTHRYYCRLGESFNPGDKFESKVVVRQRENGLFDLKLSPVAYSSVCAPQQTFEEIGHLGLYENYFEDIEGLLERLDPDNPDDLKKYLALCLQMRKKVEKGDRLWVFDYLSILSFISNQWGSKDLELLMDISILIRSLEEWFLNKSGILKAFSPSKREQSIKKAETTLRTAVITIEAINILKNGTAEDFIKDILRRINMSGYIRDENKTFSVLFKVIVLGKDLFDHMEYISEIVEYKSETLENENVLSRIVRLIWNKISQEKVRINNMLYYQRVEFLDQAEIAPIIIGLATLYNLPTVNNSFDKSEILTLICKYLTNITDRGVAMKLLNKSLALRFIDHQSMKLNGSIYRKVATDSSKLINYILQIPVQELHDGIHKYVGNFDLCYKDSHLYAIPISSRDYFGKLNSPKNLLTIVDSPLRIGTYDGSEEVWSSGEGIRYYRDKWKALLVPSEGKTSYEGVLIEVSNINLAYPSYIFCKAIIDNKLQSGVLRRSNYIPFMLQDMHLGFQVGQKIWAKVMFDQNNRIQFSIKDEIFDYSIKSFGGLGTTRSAILLHYDEKKDYSILITEDGQFCLNNGKCCDGVEYTVSFEGVFKNYYKKIPVVKIVGQEEKESRITLSKCLMNQIDNMTCMYGSGAGLNSTSFEDLPPVLGTVDSFIRLTDNKSDRYNLYHFARCVAIVEQRLDLADYYTACIQYLEMESSVMFGEGEYSIPIDTDVSKKEALLRTFPSLLALEERRILLERLGKEEDLEYLWNIIKNASRPLVTRDIAKISLAQSLLSDVSHGQNKYDATFRHALLEVLDIPALEEVVAPIIETSSPVQNQHVNYGIEGQFQEFKTSIVYTAKDSANDIEAQMLVILRTVAGFLNGQGGKLYIGVGDDGNPRGIESDLNTLSCNLDKYERIIHHYIVDKFGKDVNGAISFSFPVVNEKTICILTIPHYYTPVSLNDKFYQRQGNETREIVGSDLIPFIQRFNSPTAQVAQPSEIHEKIVDAVESVPMVNGGKEGIAHTNSIVNLSNKEHIHSDLTFSKTDGPEKVVLILDDVAGIQDKNMMSNIISDCVGSKIPIFRTALEQYCRDAKDAKRLWFTITSCIEFNSNLLGYPIIQGLSKNNNLSILKGIPQSEVNAIVRLLFIDPELISHDIQLASLLRRYCEFEIPDIAFDYTCRITSESDYFSLFKMTNVGLVEGLSIMAKDSTLVSVFSLCHTIVKLREVNQQQMLFIDKNNLLCEFIDEIDSDSVYLKALKSLLEDYKDHWGITNSPIRTFVSNNDFDGFKQFYAAREGKMQRRRLLADINALVGKECEFSIIKVRSNHYQMVSKATNINAFMPKKMSLGEDYVEGQVITAKIISANARWGCVFVAQQAKITSDGILAIPIYNLQERVTIKYCRTSRGITPYIAGFPPIKNVGLIISGQDDHFDYKSSYLGEVVAYKSPFDFSIRIIGQKDSKSNL